MRILAVDLGEKRVGTAVCCADESVVLPLETLRRSSDAQVIAEIEKIVSREDVSALVVGEPRRLDGSRGEAARRAASFAKKLSRHTRLPYTLIDESLTSQEAELRLREAGIDPRRDRERVDAIAAQILLEEAIARRRKQAE